ncbi:MAG: 50S ribosomal protein L4 [Patescibacteria group bacterium]
MKNTKINVIGSEDKSKTIAIPTHLKDVKVNPALVAQYVRVYLKNQRQGTASTKDRSEIVGTTKKMYKQKGTGNARHASAKAPIFVGGGVAGGPKPKDYFVKMNQKQKNAALASVLVSRIEEGSMMILAEGAIKESAKTKDFVEILKKSEIKLGSKITIVVDAKEDQSIVKSSRNIKGVEIINSDNINPYVLLKGKTLLMSKNAFSKISKNA